MKIAVLDAATLGADLDLSVLNRESLGNGTCRIYPTSTEEEVKARIRDTEVIVINKIKIREDVLQYANALRLIAITATGYDNVDLDACRRHGVAVCNVKGYSTDSVAQLTVAMALSLVNHLPAYTETVRSGSYTASGIANVLIPAYHEISGKTWGIVGLGNIGKKVAAVAEAFGCRVLAYKREPEAGYCCVDLDTLLKESDIVSLHLPLSAETRGMIGERELSLMKEGAILINVARGAVTDEGAVADAVRSGRLGGLGVDVYSVEPFTADHPFYALLDHPQVCLTPHMAWSAIEARERCIAEIVKNIEAFYKGETRNRVDLL